MERDEWVGERNEREHQTIIRLGLLRCIVNKCLSLLSTAGVSYYMAISALFLFRFSSSVQAWHIV